MYEVILTPDYLALIMEYAEGGSLTAHVAERWGTAKPGGLIMDEDEARYFFRVHSSRASHKMACLVASARHSCLRCCRSVCVGNENGWNAELTFGLVWIAAIH